MVPTEWGLVDFSKSKTSSLIGVLDMGEIIVEVVERGVSTMVLDAHRRKRTIALPASGLVLSHLRQS